MRPTLLTALLTLLPLSSQTPAGPPVSREQPAAPIGTATLTGLATVTVNNQPSPVRRARVIVQGDNGTSQTTDTDISGRFRVDHLQAGTYHVVIDKPGFVPLGRMSPIDVRAGQSATVTVALQRGAAIEGRLLTGDGEPAMGLTVSAVRLGYGLYGKKVVAIRQTTTDDLGRFRVHTLPPGEYYLEAAPDPRRMLSARSMPERTPQPTRTYFTGTSRLNDARLIALVPGQQWTDADFTLTSAALATVTARVTSSSAKPPASFSVRVQRVGAPAGEVACLLGLGSPGDNGFQCPNVPPGDFWFLVAARSGPGPEVEFAATRVTVEGRDVQNVPITTAPGVAVTGRVEVEGGAPLPANLQISALETEYEFPAPAPGASVNTATPPVNLGPDGAFTFAGLAGPRLLRVNRLPEGWAVKGVWLEATEISDTPVTFPAADKPRVLRVVITPRTGSIRGAVADSRNQPAAGSRVVVFADDLTRWGARSRFIKTVETDGAGRYAIGGLLPGKYRVAVVEMLDDGAWEDPDVLARLQITAAPLVVGTDALTLNLRLR